MDLCEEQLTKELVALFCDTKPECIPAAVKAALTEFSRRTKQIKWADMERLFDGQIATLKDLVPKQILEILRNGKEAVLNHAQTLNIADGNLPFAPVITPHYFGYHGIIAMLCRNGNSADIYIDPHQIMDGEKVPSSLYYHFDIEDGTARLGKSPEVSYREIRSEKRFCSTVAEIVSIATHTHALSEHHYLIALGSRYRLKYVPYLDLVKNGPRLLYHPFNDFKGYLWGAASCDSRLKLEFFAA